MSVTPLFPSGLPRGGCGIGGLWALPTWGCSQCWGEKWRENGRKNWRINEQRLGDWKNGRLGQMGAWKNGRETKGWSCLETSAKWKWGYREQMKGRERWKGKEREELRHIKGSLPLPFLPLCLMQFLPLSLFPPFMFQFLPLSPFPRNWDPLREERREREREELRHIKEGKGGGRVGGTETHKGRKRGRERGRNWDT